MKLYLSSYKLGNRTEELRKWITKYNNKICLIPNATDAYPETHEKQVSIHSDIQELEDLGFDVTLLSLKDYFGKEKELFKKLKEVNAFYVIGGNVFTLRQAMYLSGFDMFINSIKKASNYLYVAYSAGICVLANDLHGLDVCDDPYINAYNINTIWNGLGFFDYLFLPHYKSQHKETTRIDDCVEHCKIKHIKYKTLKDGEVIIESIK